MAQVAPQRPTGEMVQWAIDRKVLRGNHRYTPVAASGQEVLNVNAMQSGVLQHYQPIVSKAYEAATARPFVGQTDCQGVVISADTLHTRMAGCGPSLCPGAVRVAQWQACL